MVFLLNRNSERWCLCLLPGRWRVEKCLFFFIIELVVSFLYMLLIILTIFVFVSSLLGVLS